MQKIDEKLLDMAIRLEMGGTVSGEDAARTIREAMELADQVPSANARVEELEENLEDAEGELDVLRDVVAEFVADIKRYLPTEERKRAA